MFSCGRWRFILKNTVMNPMRQFLSCFIFLLSQTLPLDSRCRILLCLSEGQLKVQMCPTGSESYRESIKTKKKGGDIISPNVLFYTETRVLEKSALEKKFLSVTKNRVDDGPRHGGKCLFCKTSTFGWTKHESAICLQPAASSSGWSPAESRQ